MARSWYSRLVDPWWSRLGCYLKFAGCRMIHGHHLWKPLPDRYNEWLLVPEERCTSCGKRKPAPWLTGHGASPRT